MPSTSHLTEHSIIITMPPDRLTGFPTELLITIIRLLDPLSTLRCRQVNSRCKSCVDSLSEYKAYQTKFQDIIKEHRSIRNSKPPRWTIERAAKLFGVVRAGIPVDYYLFVKVLLKYPQLESYISMIEGSGQKP